VDEVTPSVPTVKETAMVKWFKLVLKRTFGKNVISVRRDGTVRHDDDFDTKFLMASVAVMTALTSTFILAILNTAGVWTLSTIWVFPAFGLGLVSGLSAGLVWRRNAIPVKTGAAEYAAIGYTKARKLLPRATRRKALQAVIAHDATIASLCQTRNSVRKALRVTGRKEWSSPLVIEELKAREQELNDEIGARTKAADKLGHQLHEIVRASTAARVETIQAREAVGAVSVLTQSRRALARAQSVDIPQLELR